MSGAPARVTVVTLGARDLPRLRSFYEALGWATGGRASDTFAWFRTGGALLALYPLDLLAHEAGGEASAVPSGFRGVTLAVNVADREDVDETLEGARQAGGSQTGEATDRSWGGRSGYFSDPEGNVWEVAWVPDSQFDERGGLLSL